MSWRTARPRWSITDDVERHDVASRPHRARRRPGARADDVPLPRAAPPRSGGRRAHRVHLGHHRPAQGRGPHPRLVAGRSQRLDPGLGLAARRPVVAGPAPLSRARARRRPLRHADRRRFGHGVRPLRRGGHRDRPRGDHVLRRAHDVPPLGRLGSRRSPGSAAPLRVRLGPLGRRALARPAPPGRRGAGALRNDRDTPHAVEPAAG